MGRKAGMAKTKQMIMIIGRKEGRKEGREGGREGGRKEGTKIDKKKPTTEENFNVSFSVKYICYLERTKIIEIVQRCRVKYRMFFSCTFLGSVILNCKFFFIYLGKKISVQFAEEVRNIKLNINCSFVSIKRGGGMGEIFSFFSKKKKILKTNY